MFGDSSREGSSEQGGMGKTCKGTARINRNTTAMMMMTDKLQTKNPQEHSKADTLQYSSVQ